MFTHRTHTVWVGILLLSSLFLLGQQQPAWSPSDLIYCEDMDADGYGARPALLCPYLFKIDCDDLNPQVHPGVIEAAYGDPICSDGLDNDCDGLTDILDNGCQECLSAADCDDGNPCTNDACVGFVCSYTYNTAPCDDEDPCTTNDFCSQGVCVGGPAPDADMDGYASEACGGTDCDDQNGLVHPGATEALSDPPTCSDGLDNDCDGATDGADPACVP